MSAAVKSANVSCVGEVDTAEKVDRTKIWAYDDYSAPNTAGRRAQDWSGNQACQPNPELMFESKLATGKAGALQNIATPPGCYMVNIGPDSGGHSCRLQNLPSTAPRCSRQRLLTHCCHAIMEMTVVTHRSMQPCMLFSSADAATANIFLFSIRSSL